MRCYGLRTALFAVVLCAALVSGASLWLGLVGAAAVSALLVALGWIIYFHSERTVLAALRARPVSEVERPDLYRIVRELAFSAHLPVPRLFVSPAAQPNILTVGYSARSASVCCTEGLLRLLTLAELRAVLAHEFAHVSRHDVAVSSWSAGLASLVASCPLIAILLHITAPDGREYRADIDGALLTGDPMALASALRKIDDVTAAQPLRVHGTLAAASHLMIAHPFPADGVGGMLSTHPPTSERVRRLEALSGSPRLFSCPVYLATQWAQARASPPGMIWNSSFGTPGEEEVGLPVSLTSVYFALPSGAFAAFGDAHGEGTLAAEPRRALGHLCHPLGRGVLPAQGVYLGSAVVNELQGEVEVL